MFDALSLYSEGEGWVRVFSLVARINSLWGSFTACSLKPGRRLSVLNDPFRLVPLHFRHQCPTDTVPVLHRVALFAPIRADKEAKYSGQCFFHTAVVIPPTVSFCHKLQPNPPPYSSHAPLLLINSLRWREIQCHRDPTVVGYRENT